MKNKENNICRRCYDKEVVFFCHSCPKKFSKLCSDCDTYIHSVIPYKNLHLRDRVENTKDDNYIKMSEFNGNKIKELEEKTNYQNDIINKLNLKIEEFKNNIYKLIAKIKNLNKEKESCLNKMIYLKTEIEKYKKENESIKESFADNHIITTKLNNELNIKEKEIEEIKYYYNNKITDLTNEKKYLLNEVDNYNNKLIEQNNINEEKIKENDLLKNKILKLEQENNENLKIISELRKENKELIRRLNNNYIIQEN